MLNMLDAGSAHSTGMAGDSLLLGPNTRSVIKENLKLTGRFLLTIVTKLPGIVDENPVKVALGLAKVIAEAKSVRHSFVLQPFG